MQSKENLKFKRRFYVLKTHHALVKILNNSFTKKKILLELFMLLGTQEMLFYQ